MSYSFDAAPRVVAPQTEKYRDKENVPTNMMHDKRIFRGNVHNLSNLRKALTPAEADEQRVTREKETRQEEMLKTQLAAFKKSKLKQTPYDIKPAATARIEVDLDYFLTDQQDIRPISVETAVEVDEFLPKPPSPKYVPKKTGIDASTQIWDTDLFCFNREVQPILDVLTNKTLEQAKLEVEEDHELESMKIYREKNAKRKAEEDEHWNQMLKRELELIAEKQATVAAARAKAARKEQLTRKIMNLQISKAYLRNLETNSMEISYEAGVYPDYREHQMSVILKDFYSKQCSQILSKETGFKSVYDNLVDTSFNKVLTSRQSTIATFKQRRVNQQQKKINSSDHSRWYRVLFINDEYNPINEFQRRLETTLSGLTYEIPEADLSMSRYTEDPKESERSGTIKPEDLPEQIEGEEVGKKPKYMTIKIDDLKKLSVSSANNIYIDTPKSERKFMVVAELLSESGERLHTISGHDSIAAPGVKLNSNCRDIRQNKSMDERIVIDLSKVQDEVAHIIIYVITANKDIEARMPYNSFQLCDHKTGQVISAGVMNEEDYGEEQVPRVLAYRIYRQEFNPRGMKVTPPKEITSDDFEFDVAMPEHDNSWHLDLYNMPLRTTNEDMPGKIREMVRQGSEYLTNFMLELQGYKERIQREEILAARQMEEKKSKMRKKKKSGAGTHRSSQVSVSQEGEEVPDLEIPIFPSRTYGPFMFRDCKYMPGSEMMEQIEDEVEGQLQREIFPDGMCLKLQDQEIQEGKMLFKAKSLIDLVLGNTYIQPAQESIVEEDEEGKEAES